MLVRREALALLLLPLLVAAASGPPSAAGLRSCDPFGPLLTVIALLAWGCIGWLLLVLLLALAGRAGSRLARVLLEQIAPASLRGLCGVAVGAAVALAATPSPASANPPPAPPVGLDLDWVQPVLATPVPRATTSRPVATPHQAKPTRTRADQVVVQPGDSLWSIAATALGPRASDRQVAQTWPRWWHANRAQIGTDPDLIHPGAVLEPPQHQGEA